MSDKQQEKPTSPTITLCLQAGSRRIPIQIDAATATVEDLYNRARQELMNGDDVQLRAGVPPRLLDRTTNATTLHDCGIRHQDRILVATMEAAPAPKESAASPGRRPKRKAAQAATAAFPEVIAEQDRAAAAATATRSPRRSKSSASSPSAKQKRTKSTASHFAKLERQTNGSAFRLRDGQPVVASPARSRKRRATKAAADGTTLEEALVESATGGLQGQWRSAVASAYEHNQAAAREAALTSDCVFEVLGGNNSEDDVDDGVANSKPQLTVTYPKGVQGRGTFTDSVPLLPREALSAALRTIDQVEELRHMPLFSPRVYWSLRYHYRDCRTVPDCLEAAIPDMDYHALRHRRRALSAKARENMRQQREEDALQNGAAETDWEAAAEAMTAVENALGLTPPLLATTSVEVAQTVGDNSWRVITPVEEDLDELKECIHQTVDPDSTEVNRHVQLLLERGIRNWRQLANLDDGVPDVPSEWIDYAQAQSVEEIMIEICDDDGEAVAVLRDDANSGTPRDLELWRRVAKTLHEEVPAYSVEQLQRWCDRAAAATYQLPWLMDFKTPTT